MEQSKIDDRKKWGAFIARWCSIEKVGDEWRVQSSRHGSRKFYRVSIDPALYYCTCPDHHEHGERCKHIYAVLEKIRQLGGEPPPPDKDNGAAPA